MSSTTRQTMNAVEAMRQHRLVSRPYGHTQLSEFVCGCGQRFVPSQLGPIRSATGAQAQSMALVHQAVAITEAASGEDPTGRDWMAMPDPKLLVPGTIIRELCTGILLQKHSQDVWVDQEGGRRTSDDVHQDGESGAVVIWMPKTDFVLLG